MCRFIIVLLFFPALMLAQDIDSLIGWWSLSEGDLVGATAGDLSGNDFVGTISGDPTYSTDPWGCATGAMTFDGNGDFLDCGDIALDGKGEASISGWVKADTTITSIMAEFGVVDDDGTGRYTFTITSNWASTYKSGNVGFVGGVGDDFWTHYGDGPDFGSNPIWKHVVMTWKTADIPKIYINAVEYVRYAGDNGSGVLRTDNGTFQIGHDGGDTGPIPGGRDFAGSMCQIRVYKKELTQTEVTTLYNYNPYDDSNQFDKFNGFPNFKE